MDGTKGNSEVNGSGRKSDRAGKGAAAVSGTGKKKKIIITAVCAAAIAVTAVVIFFFYKNKSAGSRSAPAGMNKTNTATSVTATGTTTVGMTTEELDLASLSTKLYVEDVYLSNGDTVNKGDKILKISDSTLKSAKNELERAQKSADYAYREGVITTAQEKIEAQSTYDQAAVKEKYAQQAYDETVKEVTDKISDLQDQISDEQDLIDEYTKAVNDNYYYKYYDVANKKKERDATFALQMKLYEEWNMEELTGTSSKTSTSTQSGQSSQNSQGSQSVNIPTTICGKAGFLQGYILGYSGSGQTATADSSFNSWWTANYGSSTDPGSGRAG
jgi:multidrug efflux pump subunit AcrA (membrane-fusion protein)